MIHPILKKNIILYVFDHSNEFGLMNATVNHFKAYVYDQAGEYLIGGADVYKFIEKSIKLISQEK